MLARETGAIGDAVLRKEDRRLLTGLGRFSDDFRLEGELFAGLIRSPHAHARILRIDTARARALRGVLDVITGADCAQLEPIAHSPLPSTRHDIRLGAPGGGEVFVGPHRLLPVDRVRYVGEPIAMVVATSRALAEDALEALEIEYAPLAHVSDARAAVQAGAPAVWDEQPGNLFIESRFGDAVATAAEFARAAHVVGASFHIQRVTAVTLEPRAALANFDRGTGRYTLYAGSGGAVRQKHELARVLGIAPERLRVISADVGGNFGARNSVYVEFALVLLAAQRLARPVRYVASRGEAMTSDYQGRDLASEIELALDADGRFLALRVANLSNVGAYCVSLSPLSKGSGLVTGSYAIPLASLVSRAAFTHTMSTQAYRSSGRPEVTFAIERLIDIAATRTGIDRIELRRRNLVPADAMPYTNPIGMTYDSGTYASNMDLAMRLADWDGFAARRTAARARGRLLGRGLANYVESSIGAPRERAELRLDVSERLRIVVGTQPSGQGHETSFAQVAATLLGVPVAAIDVVLGDPISCRSVAARTPAARCATPRR